MDTCKTVFTRHQRRISSSTSGAAPPPEEGKGGQEEGKKGRNVHGYGRAISYGFRVSPRFDAAAAIRGNKAGGRDAADVFISKQKKNERRINAGL